MIRARYRLAGLRPLLSLVRNIGACALGPCHGKLKVLVFHDIPPEHVDRFSEQITYISKAYRILDYAAFCRELASGSRERRPGILLTFDDGFASNFRMAETILKPLGIKAVFFVVPSFIDCRTRDEQVEFITTKMCTGLKGATIPDHLRPMQWDELRALQSQGHTIGAHTCTHARLSGLASRAELEAEILGSAAAIEARLEQKVESFAYPFGTAASVTSAALSVAAQRYFYVFSAVRGNNPPSVSRLAIRREAVWLGDPNGYVGFLVEGGLSFRYIKARRQLDRMASQVTTAPQNPARQPHD